MFGIILLAQPQNTERKKYYIICSLFSKYLCNPSLWLCLNKEDNIQSCSQSVKCTRNTKVLSYHPAQREENIPNLLCNNLAKPFVCVNFAKFFVTRKEFNLNHAPHILPCLELLCVKKRGAKVTTTYEINNQDIIPLFCSACVTTLTAVCYKCRNRL